MGVQTMAALTPERIAKVHAEVGDVVARTSESSPLAAHEKDRLLAEACRTVCDLLRDWLASDDWTGMRPRASARVADAVPRREDYASFLDQMLADAMARAGRAAGAVSLAAALVAEARAAVERTAGRHLGWTQRELFATADSRVRELRAETCKLAGDLGTAVAPGPAGEARRRRAWTALKTAIGVLPALVLAMAGASPAQMEANLSAWGHDAVRVVTTYVIAEQAQPHVLIEPPQLSGPELSL
jgi:hypothetical protein